MYVLLVAGYEVGKSLSPKECALRSILRSKRKIGQKKKLKKAKEKRVKFVQTVG